MTLVAGMIFWVVRRLLALSSTLALRYPIKKWAVLCSTRHRDFAPWAPKKF
jgi:hypothetical protein